MGQHSKYSFEMKLEAVTKYLEGSCSTESIDRSLGTGGNRKILYGHEMDYAQTAEKYQVFYQQIYQWIRKYQSNGVEGLVDKRGKRKTESEMSELENCVRKTGFFRQKSGRRNWRLYS